MGISRRERLAVTNLREAAKESSVQEGATIIDEVIQQSEKEDDKKESVSSPEIIITSQPAEKEKSDDQPVKEIDPEPETEEKSSGLKVDTPKKKGAGRPKGSKNKKEDAEPAPSHKPEQFYPYSSFDPSADLFSRLQNRSRSEKKTARISVAIYPSLVASLREQAEVIGCSVNDLINEIFIDWYRRINEKAGQEQD